MLCIAARTTSLTRSSAGIAAGHAKYAQGAASETIGNVTGSAEWQQSGADTKAAATEEIREAFNSAPDAQAQGGVQGKAAELAEKGECHCLCWRQASTLTSFAACPQTGDGVGSA